MVHPIGIGVDDVVRQRRFRDSIRLSTQQLPAPELETDEGSQVEQIGVGYGLTDRFTERSRLSGIGDRQLDLLEPSGDCAWNWCFIEILFALSPCRPMSGLIAQQREMRPVRSVRSGSASRDRSVSVSTFSPPTP